MRWTRAVGLVVGVASLGLGGCADDDSSATPGDGSSTGGPNTSATGLDSSGSGGEAAACTETTLPALQTCIAAHGEAHTACVQADGAPCSPDDATLVAALDQLQTEVEAACGEGEFGALSPQGVVGRLRNACASEAASLAWRTYGGPQGAVWPAAGGDGQACLVAAHEAATGLMVDSLGTIGACLATDDCAALADERQAQEQTAQSAVEAACGDLAALVAVSPEEYVRRAAGQTDCLTAAGHPEPGAAGPSCGPSYSQFEATRGQWTEIPVDGEQWGTLCGDGTGYAFHVRLAPEGEPLDRIWIGLQGGGVCLFEEDCEAKLATSPGLFSAMDDEPLGLGIGSDDPADNPFANWTRVYLPYCTQDVFAGGGVTEILGDLEVPRYGSVNLRAAIQMVRDEVWRLMDAEGGDGFRPDQIIAMFGGFSAGGYGTIYNYHWLLDDLQWPRTIAFPDSGLALDNGSPLGVSGLGLIKIPAWNTQPNLPPYCFAGECSVGPTIYENISPRLRQVPEQQMLILSNPRDAIQQGDAFFDDTAVWINTMRQSYCDTKDLPGINYYFTSVSDEDVHVISVRPELWSGEVDGEVMRDWFLRAVNEPDTIQSRVEEADFVDAFPGVEPYPCEVAP